LNVVPELSLRWTTTIFISGQQQARIFRRNGRIVPVDDSSLVDLGEQRTGHA